MALIIVTGGTTGGTDGTAISQGTGLNPLTFLTINTVVNAHIRTEANESEDTTFTIPSELSISFDGGSTWKTSADSPIAAGGIGPANRPIQLKQTTVASNATGTFTTSGTYSLNTSPGQVTGLAVGSVSSGSIPLTWNAATDNVAVANYRVRRATDSGMSVNLITLSSTVGTTSYTNNSTNGNAPVDGTTYYYDVAAIDAAGNVGTASSVVSGGVTFTWHPIPTMTGDGTSSAYLNPVITLDTPSSWYFERPIGGYPAGDSRTSFEGITTGKIYSQTVNQKATYTFTGTGIRIYGAKANNLGKVDIIIDTVTVASAVDEYQAGGTDDTPVKLYGAGPGEVNASLSPGSHTIQLKVRGDKNGASTGVWGMLTGLSYYG